MGLALRKEEARMARDYTTMPMKELKALARQQHPEHDPEAARVFVDRVLDMEVERRTWHAHENPGFQPISSAAMLGEQPGGGTEASDPLVMRYDRGIRIHAGHEWAREWIAGARLKPRALLAVLIQAAKLHPMPTQQTAQWARSYDFIAPRLGYYARLLGWPPGIEATIEYKKGQAIKDAAKAARVELILLAKL